MRRPGSTCTTRSTRMIGWVSDAAACAVCPECPSSIGFRPFCNPSRVQQRLPPGRRSRSRNSSRCRSKAALRSHCRLSMNGKDARVEAGLPYVARDRRGPRDDRVVGDRDMPLDHRGRLRAGRRAADCRTARDSNTARDGRVSSDPAVVPDLHQIVDLHAVFYHRIADCAPIDRAACPNLPRPSPISTAPVCGILTHCPLKGANPKAVGADHAA